jgi:hypothetical protein
MHGRILYYISLLPSLQSDAEVSSTNPRKQENYEGSKSSGVVQGYAMPCERRGNNNAGKRNLQNAAPIHPGENTRVKPYWLQWKGANAIQIQRP